ncbi:hypothetical protein TELCIR_09188 [Teladorsagia circumcincta]|uniref:Uncharacterized protein n=1 Tax=Teladorsagia circumcincta TaxID=45464 RepID=A0A2G9UFJ7_TELCI|nr:hypothetical protein TELCIR_09188 [Teladorsagia circumcincta]
MELLTLLTLVTSAVATFWGGCCNSGTYSSLSNTPIYSYYPPASSSVPSGSPIYSFYSPTSSSVPSNLPVYSLYSTPSFSLQSPVPSGARIVTVSSPTSSFVPSNARVVSVASPPYSYVPSGARFVSVSSQPTSFVQSDARIVSIASPTFSYAPSGARIVSVSSPTSSFVPSNSRVVSFYSPISSSAPSGSPVYSVYPSNPPATTIWYPEALEYANRRLLQYYNGQDGRGQFDNYPQRNHLFVRRFRQIQRRSTRHARESEIDIECCEWKFSPGRSGTMAMRRWPCDHLHDSRAKHDHVPLPILIGLPFAQAKMSGMN